MGPMMYRQRPSAPALIAAACVIVLGTCSALYMKGRVDAGIGEPSSLILIISLTAVLAGALVITAFARYTFTHLKTDRAFGREERRLKKRRSQQRSCTES